jgi:choline dehydrogenase-like flavoprotein
MKYDARSLPPEIGDYDLCIIGSGPAGFTVALELMHTGQRICLIEAGDQSVIDDETDDLKRVESRGIEIRPDSRRRILGGTSETWSGYMAPLDPLDMEARPGIHDGWPISATDIASHLDTKGYRYDIPHSSQFELSDDAVPLTKIDGLQSKTFQVQLQPLRFRKAFQHVFISPSVDLLFGAAVTRLISEDNGSGVATVHQAVFMDRDGDEHRVSAKAFVLAASAVESVRIALNSSIADPGDQIGRNFMNHPKGTIAKIYFPTPLPKDHPLFQTRGAKFGHYIGLRLPDERQKTEGLLNTYLRLEPSHDAREYPRAARLSKSFKALKQAGSQDRFRLIWGMMAEAAGIPELLIRARDRAKRKKEKFVAVAAVRCFAEMEPLPESRITLSKDVDRFGIPIPVVTHANSVRSLKTVDALLAALEKGLSAAGAGRLERVSSDLKALLENDASHHLGGLRMGHDPATSVVDENLKFHLVENLYAAGGAVFPTGGSANPTLTVVVLSIRLAETIRRSVFKADKAIADAPKPGAAFVVIGAGRRVREDVVPAIEKLATAHVAAIYATSKRAVFGLDRAYDVEPLFTLSSESLRAVSHVYVAVPPKQLKSVLQRLTEFDCSRLTLVIDTPALETQELTVLYGKFAKVAVAEDSAYLPWIPLLKNDADPITRIEFDRSGFAYHAVALAKAVVANGGARPGILRSRRSKRRLNVEFSNGTSAVVNGARDYDRGTLRFHSAGGSVVGSHVDAGNEAVIQPLVEANRCVGFRKGAQSIMLTETESQLAGSFSPDDTIVSRMLDLKRVGLSRLLSDLVAGRKTYTLSEGVEDAVATPGH